MVAKRHGQRIRTRSKEVGLQFLLNNVMWRTISKAKEEETYYLRDGLHLNPQGKKAVVKEWVTTMYPELADQSDPDEPNDDLN